MEGRHKCPVCGKFEFEFHDSFDICEVCGWEDDGLQMKNPDYSGGANRLSLNQSIELYKKSGVCKDWKQPAHNT